MILRHKSCELIESDLGRCMRRNIGGSGQVLQFSVEGIDLGHSRPELVCRA